MKNLKARWATSAGLRRRTEAPSPPRRLAQGWVVGAVGALALASSASAQEPGGEAPSKASCARAYESSQESRAAGQLQETRARLSICARPECPSFVQKDCARWLGEVEQELPSVVLRAEGLDPAAAREVNVTIDGQAVPGALDGAPIPLDPGRHELVAEGPGQPRMARVILAQQGVQNRTVTLDFEPRPAAAPSEDLRADAGSGGSPLRPYAYVAWGVGAVGLGMFAVLGTLGRADERGFKDDCPRATEDPALVGDGICYKPYADERKAVYEREFVLADVGLVTGLMGVAAGTVLFVLSAGDDAPADEGSARLHLDLSPRPGGGFASVAGAF